VQAVRRQRNDTSNEYVIACANQWWRSQTRNKANKKNVKKNPKNKKESHHVQWLETTAWNFYHHCLEHHGMFYPYQVPIVPSLTARCVFRCFKPNPGVFRFSNVQSHTHFLSESRNQTNNLVSTPAEPVFSQPKGPVADNFNQTHISIQVDSNVLIIPPRHPMYSNNGDNLLSKAQNKPLLTPVNH
jgi:hypothetical protein